MTAAEEPRTRQGPVPVPAAAPAGGGGDLLRVLQSRGFRWLQVADIAGVLAVLVLLNLVRFGAATPQSYPRAEYAVAFVLAAVLHVVVAYFGGLYEPEQRLGSRPQLPRVAGLAVVAALFLSSAALFLDRYYIPRLSLFLLPVGTSLVLAGNRRLARALRRQREGLPLALLVGAPDDVNLAREHLGTRHGPARVVGETTTGTDLLARVEASGATDVLLLSPQVLDRVYPEPLTTLERRGVGIFQRITARDTLLGLQGVAEIAGMPFVGLRTHTLPRSRARFKRSIELLALLVTAPVVAPVVAAVALYVRVVAGRGVLFRQERVGRDGVPFTLLKFRTMYPDAESGVGPVLATVDDHRVVPACRWLRSMRLDELPQLWNVVRGQMSVIGPRPERPELTARYEQLIPGYARRHEIPPGLTGLAQIHGRYHTDPEYKLGHDLQYLVNWSPVLDLQILLRTVWVVLARRV